jgi:hypothetical protein
MEKLNSYCCNAPIQRMSNGDYLCTVCGANVSPYVYSQYKFSETKNNNERLVN